MYQNGVKTPEIDSCLRENNRLKDLLRGYIGEYAKELKDKRLARVIFQYKFSLDDLLLVYKSAQAEVKAKREKTKGGCDKNGN